MVQSKVIFAISQMPQKLQLTFQKWSNDCKENKNYCKNCYLYNINSFTIFFIPSDMSGWDGRPPLKILVSQIFECTRVRVWYSTINCTHKVICMRATLDFKRYSLFILIIWSASKAHKVSHIIRMASKNGNSSYLFAPPLF